MESQRAEPHDVCAACNLKPSPTLTLEQMCGTCCKCSRLTYAFTPPAVEKLQAEIQRMKTNAILTLSEIYPDEPEPIDPVYSLSVIAIGLDEEVKRLKAQLKKYTE